MTRPDSLIDILQSHLESDDVQLPVYTQTAQELQQAMNQEGFTPEKCSELISRDQSLVSQILKSANSSFYAGLKPVTNIPDSMTRLGAKEVLRLTLMIAQRDQYQANFLPLKKIMEKLQEHAVGVAVGAQWLAERTGFKNQSQEAFLAGLIHDIGRLFLLKVLDELASKDQLSHLSEALILEIMDGLHVEQGYRLVKQMGLPDIYCDVVKLHHEEKVEDPSSLLLLVKLANSASKKLGIGLHQEEELILATTGEAQALGIRETTLAELEIMLEDRFLLDAA